jgi:hypothetical protein
MTSIPAGAILILAGYAHFWRQRHNGDLQLIGPLEDPAQAADKVVDLLWNRKKRRL